MPNVPDRDAHTKQDASSASGNALEIRGLEKSFGGFAALRGIDLDIAQGEFICFLGPSGCGKTTLLRAIAGLDPQDHGTISQNGRDISRLPVGQRDFGIVFQSYALFPNLTVERNVGYGLHRARMSGQQKKARVTELLALVGLENQAAKYPAQLSGGQQQRVALARALAPAPSLLLLDEPLSALDAQVRLHLRDQLRQLQRRLGVTTIMVTHDQDEALATADRIVVMNHGLVEQTGTPREVYSLPGSIFVAGFLGDMNFIRAAVTGPGLAQAGSASLPFPALRELPPGTPVNLCLRPADVIVRMPHLPIAGALKTVVKSVSFRGSFYRLSLHSPPLGQSLEVEIPRSTWEELGVTEGSILSIVLPQDKMLVFPKNG